MMVVITYPPPAFQVKEEKGREFIFDQLRKKWIALTPEEWVRQNFVQYLLQVKKYPSALIALEKEIQVGEMKKRFDILVYDSNHRPWLMVECKAMNVQLTEKVLEQLLRYHISTDASFLVITNGEFTFGWIKTDGHLQELSELPSHGE